LNSQTVVSGRPKAYLNWVLFDEQLKYVGSSSGFDQVPAESVYGNGGGSPSVYVHQQNGLVANKSGYLYIYVSNETPNIDVFFDNLQVTHLKGPLLEETHYYPFGLTMQGISSEALKVNYAENKKKYNGIEYDSDFGLEVYEAELRYLDPQMGRWWQVDPKIENMEMWSPYASNYDNPIRYSDPLGDEGQDCCWTEVKEFFNQLGYNAKNNLAQWGERISNVVDQMGENAKARWEARADPLHQMIDNPFSMIGGPVGTEIKAAETVLSLEGNSLKTAINTEVKATLNAESQIVKAEGSALQNAEARAAKLSKNQRPGEDFTKAGKDATKEVNKAKNGGQTVCENCGVNTTPAQQSKKGVTPPKTETQIDHKIPKSKGGSGTPDNGQVLCRECNLKKSNH
jgi:RHS repeat-associated protein